MNQDEQPLVTVLTPFYNTAEYLEECIESVLRQTYSNWEYILVNNFSDDGSRDIAERYTARDNRIRLIDNEDFLNQVDNYNNALTLVSAESSYCKIIQADDWLFPDCLASMVEIGETYPNVNLIGAYGLHGDRVYLSGLPYPSWSLSGRDAARTLLVDRVYVFGSPTSVIYRSDSIRSRRPFYRTDSPVEDAEVCFDILADSDFGFVHQVLTFTRTENDSITKSTRSFNMMLLTELLCCRRYGRSFLAESEYEERMKALEHEYFLYLGESLLRRRDDAFWNFHLPAIQGIGEHFNLYRRIKYGFLAFIDLALNPKSTIERLIELKKKQPPGS